MNRSSMREQDEFLRDLNPASRTWGRLVGTAIIVAVVVLLIVFLI